MQRSTQTEKFMENYRFRNGIEAIPSQLRRNHKIDHLPYRGLLRKKFGYAMAVLAINVRRVLKYAQEDAKRALDLCLQLLLMTELVILFDISQVNQKYS